MLEAEYKKLVLADYDAKRIADALPAELLSPTPGRIKSEAIKVCYERFDPRDKLILNSFVDPKEGMAGYRAAFQTCDADLFRQLVKLIKEPVINTDIIYVNLLAWLIDFKPRPFHPELNMPPKATAPFVTPKIEVPPSGQPATKKSSKKVWLFAALILLVCAVVLIFIKSPGRHYTGHEGCMVWNADHYEPIACNDQSGAVAHAPINWQLVDHFRQITKPESLTLYSVRKVYYAKHNGTVAFFTGNGPDPLDTDKRLLPMTDYILKKYVYHIIN